MKQGKQSSVQVKIKNSIKTKGLELVATFPENSIRALLISNCSSLVIIVIFSLASHILHQSYSLPAYFEVLFIVKWCRGAVVKHADSQHRGCQFDPSMCHNENNIGEEGNGKSPHQNQFP